MGTYAYDKAATRFYALKLNRKTDADLIDLLDRQQNVQRFLKDLMRDALLRTRENHSEQEGPRYEEI